MKVLITGTEDFPGKNIKQRLAELQVEVVLFNEDSAVEELPFLLANVDFIFHLFGIHRPQHEDEFMLGNVEFTQKLCAYVQASGRKIPIVFTSSTQATLDNPYGKSKYLAEQVLLSLSYTGNPVYIYRLPHFFGKWCRPNYNSVVATFCYNISHDLPIQIHDPTSKLNLVYIDDIIDEFIFVLQDRPQQGFRDVNPVYQVTVGELYEHLYAFKKNRETLLIPEVGVGFLRALYATYVSYYSSKDFSYCVPQYGDERGVFVEMLKTTLCGQVSFFTAPPGATRGEHYHHTKTEKFLVIRGNARFGFRNILTDECVGVDVSGRVPQIVETIPGWAHNITNTGAEEMIVMLWASEVFDRARPDTIAKKV